MKVYGTMRLETLHCRSRRRGKTSRVAASSLTRAPIGLGRVDEGQPNGFDDDEIARKITIHISLLMRVERTRQILDTRLRSIHIRLQGRASRL